MNLRLVTVCCSVVFTLGTLLQNVVIIDLPMMTRAMALAGADAGDAAGFTSGLRVVGWVFVAGNALGLLAGFGWRWLWWVVLLVNAGQGAGAVVIPPEVFRATVDVHGWVGLLPSMVTDGGAVVLVVVLVVFRGRWPRDTKSQECLIDSGVAA